MSTQIVSSVEEFLAAVEAAEQRLAAGEAKARRAKTLLLQAEKARDEAAAHKAEAERRLATVEEALKKAHALKALLGDAVISQGEALLQEARQEAQVEVERLVAEAEAAQAEVARLTATPEVQAYLGYREAQEQSQQEAQAQIRGDLEARLWALRPGAAVGQGEDGLKRLAAEAEKAGFSELAAQAQDAAEAARQVTRARVQAEAALRKRQLTRWAERRVGEARPGDFVFVLEEAGNGPGAAVHLRPVSASSGRLRFQAVAALGVENPPDEYGDVPSRGRAWRWRNPPAGEIEGLSEAQAEVVAGIVKGKLRSGWSINRANARLAARPAVQRMVEDSAAASETRRAAAQETVAPAVIPLETETAALLTTPSVGDLEGLSPQAVARLRQVGLCTRRAVEDTLAAGDDVFLALPGIGSATLAAVRAWLDAPTQTETTDGKAEEQAQTAPYADEEPSDVEQGGTVAIIAAPAEPIPAITDLITLAVVSDASLAASAVCEDAQPAYQPQPQLPESTITVEGDGVDGQRLAQWQGVARVGLMPVARRLGLEEVQVLVHEDEGQSTLVAYWPGGEATLSCPVDGRAGQMRAVRELVQRIRAAV
ncbi:MAG: hypothetical protein JXA14_11125 [Anaerolineae bacterium]|nr:hypothetical protein [Anaerolineae bacterium]